MWYVGATDNLFDLRDRESDDEREVLDTGGVPAKGAPTVKSVNMVLEDPRGMQSRVQMIMEQKKMLPWPGGCGAAVAVGKDCLALRRCWSPRVR